MAGALYIRCPCCDGSALRKERVPASWKSPAPAKAGVIQQAREKFSCRSCETIARMPSTVASDCTQARWTKLRVQVAGGLCGNGAGLLSCLQL